MNEPHVYFQTNQRAGMPFSMAKRVYFTEDEAVTGYKEDSRQGESFAQYRERMNLFRVPAGITVYSEEIKRLQARLSLDYSPTTS